MKTLQVLLCLVLVCLASRSEARIQLHNDECDPRIAKVFDFAFPNPCPAYESSESGTGSGSVVPINLGDGHHTNPVPRFQPSLRNIHVRPPGSEVYLDPDRWHLDYGYQCDSMSMYGADDVLIHERYNAFPLLNSSGVYYREFESEVDVLIDGIYCVQHIAQLGSSVFMLGKRDASCVSNEFDVFSFDLKTKVLTKVFDTFSNSAVDSDYPIILGNRFYFSVDNGGWKTYYLESGSLQFGLLFPGKINSVSQGQVLNDRMLLTTEDPDALYTVDIVSNAVDKLMDGAFDLDYCQIFLDKFFFTERDDDGSCLLYESDGMAGAGTFVRYDFCLIAPRAEPGLQLVATMQRLYVLFASTKLYYLSDIMDMVSFMNFDGMVHNGGFVILDGQILEHLILHYPISATDIKVLSSHPALDMEVLLTGPIYLEQSFYWENAEDLPWMTIVASRFEGGEKYIQYWSTMGREISTFMVESPASVSQYIYLSGEEVPRRQPAAVVSAGVTTELQLVLRDGPSDFGSLNIPDDMPGESKTRTFGSRPQTNFTLMTTDEEDDSYVNVYRIFCAYAEPEDVASSGVADPSGSVGPASGNEGSGSQGSWGVVLTPAVSVVFVCILVGFLFLV